MKTSKKWFGPALVALLSIGLVQGVNGDEARFSGRWEGSIELPGVDLGVKIDLRDSEEGWQGTIDIPMQGAEDLPLEDIVISGSSISFSIANIPGAPTFSGSLEGARLKGTFRQGGGDFPFDLGREALEEPKRPQEPNPPYPYQSEEVSYEGPAGKISGTLTLPKEGPPAAAVLLISGSGPQNRDGEVFGHKSFHVLADHLTRKGVAVLRVDDRGVGESEGSFSGATSLDFVEDARAGLHFLRSRMDVKDRVGLLGLSEGGLIAPILETKEAGVGFLVLVAAPGVSGREVLARQRVLIAQGTGLGSERIQRREALFEELVSLSLAAGKTRGSEGEASRKERMWELALEIFALDGAPGSEEAVREQVEAMLEQLASPWFQFFLTHDPQPVLAKVKAPVLALYGSKDLQVDPEQNQGPLEASLRRGGNEEVEVVRLQGLNHLMQTAGTGHPSEYWALEETFAPVALEKISDWILHHFPRSAGGGEETGETGSETGAEP